MPIHKVLILDGMADVTDADLSGLAVSFMNPQGGIAKTSDYAVTAPGGSYNVNIAGGRAWIPSIASPPTIMYGTYLDSPATLAIAQNTNPNSRIDYVVLYVDLTASPNSTGSNIPQFADIQGVNAISPTPPSPTDITNIIGATNPYLIISQVGPLPSGYGSVTSGMITSLRTFAYFTTGQIQTIPTYEEFTDQGSTPGVPSAGSTRLFTIGGNLFLQKSSGPIVQIGSSSNVNNGNSGSAPSVDWTQGITQAYTLNSATVTFTFTNPVAGEKLLLYLTQDGVGGRLAVWPTGTGGVLWSNGVAPTLSTGTGAIDVVGFLYNSIINKYIGFFQPNFL